MCGPRNTTDFETQLENDSTGPFCHEPTSGDRGDPFGAADRADPAACGLPGARPRHKHVYNGLVGVVRDGDDLPISVTFPDCTDSTLYDDIRVRRLTGDSEGLCAYDKRHRADEVHWNV